MRLTLKDKDILEKVSLFCKLHSEDIREAFLAYSYYILFLLRKEEGDIKEIILPYIGKITKEGDTFILEFRDSFKKELEKPLRKSIFDFFESFFEKKELKVE